MGEGDRRFLSVLLIRFSTPLEFLDVSIVPSRRASRDRTTRQAVINSATLVGIET